MKRVRSLFIFFILFPLDEMVSRLCLIFKFKEKKMTLCAIISMTNDLKSKKDHIFFLSKINTR